MHELGSAPLALETDGFLHARPGVTVLRTIADPYGDGSVAVEYAAGGRTFWYAAAFSGNDLLVSTRTRADPRLTFEEWAAGQPLGAQLQVSGVEVDPGVDPFDAVDLRADGTVHVSRGVVVTRLERDPWPEPAGSWAVALVYQQNGETYWFAGRQTGTDGTTVATPPIAGRTFEDWIADQRAELLRGGGA